MFFNDKMYQSLKIYHYIFEAKNTWIKKLFFYEFCIVLKTVLTNIQNKSQHPDNVHTNPNNYGHDDFSITFEGYYAACWKSADDLLSKASFFVAIAGRRSARDSTKKDALFHKSSADFQHAA